MMVRAALAALVCCTAAAACSKDAAPATAGSDSTAATAGSGSGRRIEPIQRPVRPGLRGDDGQPPVLGDERGRPGGFRGRMAHFDQDGDGVLSDDERLAMMAARATSVVERLDTDHDGTISQAELEGSPMARRLGDFAAADADHDGRLTADELRAAMADHMRDSMRGGWRGSNAPDDGGE